LAFGLDEDNEPFTNAHLIGQKLQGQVGLIFTNRTSEDISTYLSNYSAPEFATPGTEAVADVELLSGTDVFKGYATSNEEYLKKLGLDMEIMDSNIHLVKPFLAAEKGKPLTVEQSKILKFLGIKLSQFRVFPVAFLTRSGEFNEY
jgi:mRNA turnover protein 4